MRRTHACLPIALPLTALALAGCGSSRPADAVPAASLAALSAPAGAAHGSVSGIAHRTSRHTRAGETGTDAASLTPSDFSEGGRSAAGSPSTHQKLPASPGPGTRHGRGTYVGPDNDGASSCGYQNVGPGLEQAEAFIVRGVSCHIARTVALGAKGHVRNGRHYTSHRFACVVRLGGKDGLARYRCTRGDARVSFVVS